MNAPGKIKKLEETVVNRIAAGEIIQRSANALKELIENSLDAKATSIQVIAKEGGLKLLQIQDNGTGIRKEDMGIVCERFTTSKLQTFEDLQSITTYGFRGEALASISHVSLLTITTKTVNEKCAYKASYVDSKMKAPPKSCAGNQGTTILIENLFYNIATRRKALSNTAEEFSKISDVVTKYAVHNPKVGFSLKKHGEITPQVRTPANSTKMSNTRILYGNPVARELLEVELTDNTYKFKMHALVTNPNYSNKKMTFLLFINNRLVENSIIRKMLEELYTFYLPKKSHPWCYISLEIDPQNVDVNVHPTKHEVKFLHEFSIIERMRDAIDEKLSASNTSRTFYVQARLPKANITKEVLQEVLPEYEKDNNDKTKKIRPQEMIRTDATDQKLDKFNFTIHTAMKYARNDNNVETNESTNTRKTEDSNINDKKELNIEQCSTPDIEDTRQKNTPKDDEVIQVAGPSTSWSNVLDDTTSSTFDLVAADDSNLVPPVQSDSEEECDLNSLQDMFGTPYDEIDKKVVDDSNKEKCIDVIADKARKQVYKCFGNINTATEKKEGSICKENTEAIEPSTSNKPKEVQTTNAQTSRETDNDKNNEKDEKSSEEKSDTESTYDFKSYSINNFRREVKLTSILRLRKEVENECHEGMKQILSELTFVGCIDSSTALVQSGVNLYLCDTKKLAEELFYEIMLYDFANYGVIKFSEPIPLYDLAMLGLGTEEAGWTENDGPKDELATSVKELLLEKTEMLREYFSIVIDKKGNLKSLPVLLEKYFPNAGGLPLYVLRLATEVEWSAEQPCFHWKYVTEHVLYTAIKESLLPPKHFAHDSTILQIANLPDLYKVFERC
ncbi:PREDICTED: LOW QUALITY PROTEIN: DNA mismatch repair protein Mlh1 [Habropoda laboriosa]|uniref:LOW QUALITY PROTEIN: DNA mismatch repair protein Mlh1 n=1 Tax=Habropoda laboriosa TaxID=597456 RepID=UPI00083E268A|nr:PREDICTED: LOW QUALITY PROTEIN: DNA mismatch repair protein Mlh1 [Habropoda laboriosa]